jgi:hypothetical protein
MDVDRELSEPGSVCSFWFVVQAARLHRSVQASRLHHELRDRAR